MSAKLLLLNAAIFAVCCWFHRRSSLRVSLFVVMFACISGITFLFCGQLFLNNNDYILNIKGNLFMIYAAAFAGCCYAIFNDFKNPRSK